jgi:multidrug efflux system outer membrane protein
MNRHIRLSALLVAVSLFAACARTPVPDIAPTDVPTAWEGPVVTEANVWPDIAWWENFNSAELTEFLELVKANNFDFQNNLRTLETAQIQLREAGFQLWPTPNVQVSTNASTSTQTLVGGGSQGGGSSGPFNLGASVSYSGILSKPLNHERALNDYQSRLAQVADTALNTMGTAASTYFNLLFLRDQRVATQLSLENAETVLQYAQARVNAGIDLPINLLNQQISVENIRNTIRNQEQQDFQARATLALLIGRGVQGFDIAGRTLEGISVPAVQPGIPSELLVRRPDLVQAEVSLRNAAISVDLARVNFFPQISLSGSANASSPALLGLVTDPATTAVSLSSSLALTLLDNGARKRNLETTRLSLETSLANYRRTVISAFNEVELALRNIELLKAQGLVQEQNLVSAEEQFRLADLRYRAGTVEYETVLQAQLSLFNQRNSVLQNRLSQLNAIINFYQSLGGGWEAGTILVDQPAYAQAAN